jgi:hypothetical protein
MARDRGGRAVQLLGHGLLLLRAYEALHDREPQSVPGLVKDVLPPPTQARTTDPARRREARHDPGGDRRLKVRGALFRQVRAQLPRDSRPARRLNEKGTTVNLMLSGRVLDLSMLGRDVDARYRQPTKSMSSLTL